LHKLDNRILFIVHRNDDADASVVSLK